MPPKNSPQIEIPKQLSVKTKKPEKKNRKKKRKYREMYHTHTRKCVSPTCAIHTCTPRLTATHVVISDAHGCCAALSACAVRREHAVVRVEC